MTCVDLSLLLFCCVVIGQFARTLTSSYHQITSRTPFGFSHNIELWFKSLEGECDDVGISLSYI